MRSHTPDYVDSSFSAAHDMSASTHAIASAAETPTLFVVDDDAQVRNVLCLLMKAAGFRVESFPSAQTFLAAYNPKRPGCVLLDLAMPGMGGIELQQQLAAYDPSPTIIFLTGQGDVPTAMQAMHAGAVDYIQKPYRGEVLVNRIHEAMAGDHENRRAHAEAQALEGRRARLTARELQVMELLASGRSTKAIASELGISPKTVDKHRAKVLEKMGVDNPIELSNLVSRRASR